MPGNVWTFTAAVNNGTAGQYNWKSGTFGGANWTFNDGASGFEPFGPTSVALLLGSNAYTVVLNFNINLSGGVGALEINDAAATLALGANNLEIKDGTDFSGTSGGTGTPLELYAGTITDAGGILSADASLAPGLGTIILDGAITGFGKVEGTLSGTGSVEASGGVLELTNLITSTTNGLVIDSAANSVLKLDAAVAAGEQVTFNSLASGVLEIVNPGAFAATVNGLAIGAVNTPTANYIDVQSSVTQATLVANAITLFNGVSQVGTIALGSTPGPGTYVDWTSDGSLGGTDIFLSTTPCYARGTRILTDQGDVAVEEIAEGTRVMTLQGARAVPMPVVWVGRMRVHLARHPRPEAAAPIRIRRHAFAEDLPHRDVLLSPDHCLFIDGQLFVARSLVNGMSIVQDMSWPDIEYFHVETERHAIVLAEGLPAETYLDTGNRAYFDNSGVALLLHPEFTVNAGLRCWQEDACAPLAVAPEAREPVWRRLAARAEALGFAVVPVETTEEPDLRLAAGGSELRPVSVLGDRHVFLLPRPCETVRLLSRAARVAELRPWVDDPRRLGVAISRIVLRVGGASAELAPDDPALTSGWWAVEGANEGFCRWTDGAGVIELPALAEGPMLVEVQVKHRALYAREVVRFAAMPEQVAA